MADPISAYICLRYFGNFCWFKMVCWFKMNQSNSMQFLHLDTSWCIWCILSFDTHGLTWRSRQRMQRGAPGTVAYRWDFPTPKPQLPSHSRDISGPVPAASKTPRPNPAELWRPKGWPGSVLTIPTIPTIPTVTHWYHWLRLLRYSRIGAI